MGDKIPAIVMPEIVGDNPATPDKCPICGAEPSHSSIHSVEYACGGTLAPLPGRMPQVWGGTHPPIAGGQVTGSDALRKLNETPAQEPSADSLKIPVGNAGPAAMQINPGPHIENLPDKLRQQIGKSMAKFSHDIIQGGTRSLSEILSTDIFAMLTTGEVQE